MNSAEQNSLQSAQNQVCVSDGSRTVSVSSSSSIVVVVTAAAAAGATLFILMLKLNL